MVLEDFEFDFDDSSAAASDDVNGDFDDDPSYGVDPNAAVPDTANAVLPNAAEDAFARLIVSGTAAQLTSLQAATASMREHVEEGEALLQQLSAAAQYNDAIMGDEGDHLKRSFDSDDDL